MSLQYLFNDPDSYINKIDTEVFNNIPQYNNNAILNFQFNDIDNYITLINIPSINLACIGDIKTININMNSLQLTLISGLGNSYRYFSVIPLPIEYNPKEDIMLGTQIFSCFDNNDTFVYNLSTCWYIRYNAGFYYVYIEFLTNNLAPQPIDASYAYYSNGQSAELSYNFSFTYI